MLWSEGNFEKYLSFLQMPESQKTKKLHDGEAFLCGGRGIRTPGGVTLNSFQDCRIRPLCHSSNICELARSL